MAIPFSCNDFPVWCSKNRFLFVIYYNFPRGSRMKNCVNRLVDLCLRHGIASDNQVIWLRYSLEKRISSSIGLIPFILIALHITDFWGTFGFIVGFYVLRSQVNGYHAKTLRCCLLISLGSELLFLLLLYPLLTPVAAILLTIICAVVLILSAPYKHTNMHYSNDEVVALRHSIRMRVIFLTLTLLVLSFLRFNYLWKGLTTGIALATFFLSLAYISEWRKHI